MGILPEKDANVKRVERKLNSFVQGKIMKKKKNIIKVKNISYPLLKIPASPNGYD